MNRFTRALSLLALAAACKGAPARPQMPVLPGMAASAPPTFTGNDPRSYLFIRKGCPTCHTISALGVKSGTDVGPDLTYAYSDVVNRFNEPLEQFLPNPTGTMQMVLGQLIKLTPEERDSVIHILKRLHDEQPAAAPH